ncbi:hypothetical protein G9A89_007142 [Geosiphon pyriformis]|nr:hypothetical protein G9A89_007142 [Geosiphon pyriformis]
MPKIECFVGKWSTLDDTRAHVFADLCESGVKSEVIFKHLLLVRKDYRKSKLFKSRLAEEAFIKKAIEQHMKKFCSDKGGMIRNVLNWPFCKVVLDYLVVDEELVLELDDMKLKRDVLPVLSNLWAHQYASLNYVKDDAFSDVMSVINKGKLLLVVMGLPDGKAAGLSGIANEFWKHAWISMIPKPYNWDGILMNTQPIALIETAKKILSKILSDQILATYSKFGVLRGDNFSVLKSTSTQSSVFAIGLVIEDALEKNWKLWLVLQNMHKAYDSIDRVNRVMTDFGLSDNYVVHDGLDQGEVFSLLLWRIFYDLLLCEVKQHEHLFGDCQTSTQYALNIASEFFSINNISINNEKTVAISINQGVQVTSLSISSRPISIAKKSEAYRYLEIFLSTDGLSKPSFAKAHSDIRFFINVVLRKAVMDKQFSYLVLAVLQPIISYCTQFSFVSLNVCHKWDVMVRKGLKIKACLPHNFSDAALHHSLLYGLKSFKQLQSESKLAAVVSFSNAFGILKCLFNHRFLDLQVLSWAPLDLLQFPVRLHVSPVNNFLVGMVRIFLHDGLSLVNHLPSAFRSPGVFSMSSVLDGFLYYDFVCFLKRFGVVFADRLDLRRPVPFWFGLTSKFLVDGSILLSGSFWSVGCSGLNIFDSEEFSKMQSCLHELWSSSFEVFMDGLLVNTGSGDVADGTAVYFFSVDLSISVGISGLLSSTLAKLQAVMLALECVPSSSMVALHFDSQAVINACVSEMSFAVPDFCVPCWVERCYIFNLKKEKDLSVNWVKVKGHSGVYGNIRADFAVGAAICSQFFMSVEVQKCFLKADGMVLFGNICHFARDLHKSVCRACWEAGPNCDVIPGKLVGCVNWTATSRVWHLDSHMLAGFTSQKSSGLWLYLMKAVYRHLPVAVQKRLYNKGYPGVLCLLCGEVELPDHVLLCILDASIWEEILAGAFTLWVSLLSPCFLISSVTLMFLNSCSSDVGLYLVLCKGFVMSDWCLEAIDAFKNKKRTAGIVIDFVRGVVELHYTKV